MADFTLMLTRKGNKWDVSFVNLGGLTRDGMVRALRDVADAFEGQSRSAVMNGRLMGRVVT